MIRESHSIVPPDPKLDGYERTGLVILGFGLLVMFSSLFAGYEDGVKQAMFWSSLAAVFVGGLSYGVRTHLKRAAGIQSNGITHSSLSARGAAGWTMGVVLTGLYSLYYWFPKSLQGLVELFDPLSHMIRKAPADQYFLYGTLYTIAVIIMGTKAIVKYRHSRYQMIRTGSIMFCQFFLAWTVPYWMSALNQPEFYPTYFWPLSYGNLFPDSVKGLANSDQAMAMFVLGWGIVMILIVTPFLTYKLGKRWYCSWVCGCGGLANTAGDSWRQLSDKSMGAWKIERYSIYTVLVLIIVTTAALWLHAGYGILGSVAPGMKKFYGFFIGSVLSGVVGVGFYPILGTRIWCRFACPMAAILGLIQRFKSRFRITTNGAQCISCGNCSKYCEMGIDVRWYAQRGQDIVRASCVGCGICSAVCPRGVLNLENGPKDQREEYNFDLLSDYKSRHKEIK